MILPIFPVLLLTGHFVHNQTPIKPIRKAVCVVSSNVVMKIVIVPSKGAFSANLKLEVWCFQKII